MKDLVDYIGARDKTARSQPFLQKIEIRCRRKKPFILDFGYYKLEFDSEKTARMFLSQSCDLSDCKGGKEYLIRRREELKECQAKLKKDGKQ